MRMTNLDIFIKDAAERQGMKSHTFCLLYFPPCYPTLLLQSLKEDRVEFGFQYSVDLGNRMKGDLSGREKKI